MTALLDATAYVTLFGLVLVRLSSLMISGTWWFGHTAIPMQAKFGFALALSLLVAPTVGMVVPPPSTMLDLLWLVLGEALVGAAAGLVVGTVLSGLQLAGDLIDQQAGTALGEVFNPASGDSMTPTGIFFVTVATAALLAAEPFGLEERLLGGVLESFDRLPPGRVTLPAEGLAGTATDGHGRTAAILSGLVQQSAVLALRVAAPLLAVMAIVSITLGTLGATVPQINVLVLGFAIRAGASLIVVAISLSPAMDVTLQTAFAAVDEAIAMIGTFSPSQAP